MPNIDAILLVEKIAKAIGKSASRPYTEENALIALNMPIGTNKPKNARMLLPEPTSPPKENDRTYNIVSINHTNQKRR